MITKHIKKHTIKKLKRITMEWATMHDIEVTILNIKNYGYNIIDIRTETFHYDKRHRCEIDFTVD